MTTKIKEFKGSLNAIFNDATQNTKSADFEPTSQSYLPINRIRPNPIQPRQHFDAASLDELTQSIRANGVIQPIIVRPIDNGFYEVIAGERRWRASISAGLEKIPVVIRECESAERMAIALIENIQRENLSALEEAQAIQALLTECSMTHNQVAESLGKSRATISNLLRLLHLEMEVKSMLHSGLLEMGHARAILSLSGASQINAAEQIVSRGLSVREAEKLVQNYDKISKKTLFNINNELEKKARFWERQLAEKAPSKVKIHFQSEGKGRVIFYFDSEVEGNWLLDHLKILD